MGGSASFPLPRGGDWQSFGRESLLAAMNEAHGTYTPLEVTGYRASELAVAERAEKAEATRGGRKPLLTEEKLEASFGAYGTHSDAFNALNFEEVLPKWAYAEEVGRLAKLPGNSKAPVPMGICVGPGVVYAKWCVVLHMVGIALLFLLAGRSSGCKDSGVAEYANWLWWPAVPLLLVVGGLEWHCCRYAMVPYIQACHSFRVMNREVNFWTWMASSTVLLVLAWMDGVTDTFFTAASVASHGCDGNSVNKIWEAVLQQSVFSRFGPYYKYARFDVLVLAVWLLTFLQWIVPLLQSTPAYSEDAVDYVVSFLPPGKHKLQFKNIFGHVGVNLGNVLYSLGESTGNAFLIAHQPWYARSKLLGQLMGLLHESVHEGKIVKADEVHRPLAILEGELERAQHRFFLAGVLENAISINLQISLLAMRMAVHYQVDYKNLLNILLSLFSCLSRVASCRQTVTFSNDLQVLFECVLEQCMDSDDSQERRDVENRLAKIRRDTRIIAAIGLCFLLCTIYAVAKLVHVYTCPYSTWNLTGCVDLSSLNLHPHVPPFRTLV
eukprot:TRINITY_DN74152_c0_g1_i1.p1 TRINITY_DN74152_c0_g1~~TRINITY_DN74152_c0_g1_i1.p1  ORF type:complete len:552 (+),score=77.56 TRINITY_DN74152_c0_g1_i1:17-1672(+)